MNLTWHIVKKDLRALRWPLVLWTLLIVTKLGMGVVLLTADGTEGEAWFVRIDGTAKLLAALECAGFVLVAALVQEDLLVGTTAFWVTRPISGGRLLRAKLAGIGLVFGVLPLLVTLPWWLGCGYGWREIAWAAAETAALQAVVVLVGLLWAVVTDGLARFLMWTLVMLVAFPSIAGSIAVYHERTHASPGSGVVATRIALVISLAVLGVLAVVVHQYLTRRTWRSVSVIGGAVALIAAVALWWPWSWHIDTAWKSYLTGLHEKGWATAAEPPGLRFTLARADLQQMSSDGRRAERPARLRLQFKLDGLPRTQALMFSGANEFTLRWADGQPQQDWAWFRTEQSWNNRLGWQVLSSHPETVDATVDLQAIQTVPMAVAARLDSGPAAYTLRAQFGLMEIASSVPVPLAPGARSMIGPTGERVAHAEKEGEQLLVTFVRHWPSFLLDYAIGISDFMLGVRQANEGWLHQYLLVSQAKDYLDWGTEERMLRFRVGTVAIEVQTMAYRATKAGGGPKPLLAAIDALNAATFLKVNFRESARFTHEFKVDPLVVERAAP